jgi:hypothetical protein
VVITDTAFYRYPYYHTALDTPDKVTYDAFARATEGLYGGFAALAADAGLLSSRRRSPDDSQWAATDGLRLAEPPGNGHWMG